MRKIRQNITSKRHLQPIFPHLQSLTPPIQSFTPHLQRSTMYFYSSTDGYIVFLLYCKIKRKYCDGRSKKIVLYRHKWKNKIVKLRIKT